jgi:ribosomal protein RSM22 (predicted rRNA methylase)
LTLLPPRLSAALAGLAEGKARGALSSRSRTITQTYQSRRNSREVLTSDDDALAYALARMPATFAATTAALEQLLEAHPSFEPNGLLDIGCGPGTASFAAAEVFPALNQFQMLDRNGPFLALAQELAAKALPDCAVAISAHELDRAARLTETDLVIASYVLAELSANSQQRLVTELWSACKGALLLVEPGTPDGHARLLEARQALLAEGAFIAAPCTHAAPCPLVGDRWCRTLTRVQRSRDHKFLKGGDRPFEDEPYAYLAVTRQPAEKAYSHRIISRPAERKADITLELCGSSGTESVSFASRDREKFKQIKRLRWGDAVLIPIQAPEVSHEV